MGPGVVVHTFNPSSPETEAAGATLVYVVDSRIARAMWKEPGQKKKKVSSLRLT